jgi:hypothetical protein
MTCSNGTLSGSPDTYRYRTCGVPRDIAVTCTSKVGNTSTIMASDYGQDVLTMVNPGNTGVWVVYRTGPYLNCHDWNSSLADFSQHDGCIGYSRYPQTFKGGAYLVRCTFADPPPATPPANCTSPWGSTVAHGTSITAYQASSVWQGSSCTPQTRTCTDGALSGNYVNPSCVVQPYSYNWSYGAYGACSRQCEGGTQTRSATCQRSDGVAVSSAFCAGNPTTTASCNTGSCLVAYSICKPYPAGHQCAGDCGGGSSPCASTWVEYGYCPPAAQRVPSMSVPAGYTRFDCILTP